MASGAAAPPFSTRAESALSCSLVGPLDAIPNFIFHHAATNNTFSTEKSRGVIVGV